MQFLVAFNRPTLAYPMVPRKCWRIHFSVEPVDSIVRLAVWLAVAAALVLALMLTMMTTQRADHLIVAESLVSLSLVALTAMIRGFAAGRHFHSMPN